MPLREAQLVARELLDYIWVGRRGGRAVSVPLETAGTVRRLSGASVFPKLPGRSSRNSLQPSLRCRSIEQSVDDPPLTGGRDVFRMIR